MAAFVLQRPAPTAFTNPTSQMSVPNIGNASRAWQSGNAGDIISYLLPMRQQVLDRQLDRQLALQAPGLQLARDRFNFESGPAFGEEQRRFDISSQMQFNDLLGRLGLGYAQLGPQYLNSLSNFFNW